MTVDLPNQPHGSDDDGDSSTTRIAETLGSLRNLFSFHKSKSKNVKNKASNQSLSVKPVRAAPNWSSSKNGLLSLSIQVGIEQLVEDDLHRFRLQRLEESRQRIFISPMAKANLQARDDTLFSLMDNVYEFLTSNSEVMLILGDSGAGKSTFNRHLEHQLWTNYSTGGPIPLHVNLPSIYEPEKDMVTKQLQMHSFEDEHIREMKQNREFILICDGYDESQLTTNLYRTNRLNQHGQWRAKMVISCRTQFLGSNYLDRFVPQGNDHYQHPTLSLFQEAVIAPFSHKQVEDYVTLYVPLEPRPWATEDYMRMLITIPNLMDLVKNPFLLALSLEALPGVTKNQKDLSNIKITRVQLYDHFMDQWLSVNMRRLQNSTLSKEDKAILDQLVEVGFSALGADYSTRLAEAIFDRQSGNPVVQYDRLKDQDTWKSDFFGSQPVARLLRESSPLVRTGTLFRFIHRSVLEYFFSRCIYDPTRSDEDIDAQAEPGAPVSQLLDADGALFQRDLLKEPSVIQFLCDRVNLDPTFEQQLRDVIDMSKTDANAATAATNAITILVRAGVTFNGADLRGVRIPGADLSNGQFDFAQFQGADLSSTNLTRSWLRQADFCSAKMESVTFGELPYLETDSLVTACCFSPDMRMLGMAVYDEFTYIYDASTWTRIHCLGGHIGAVMSIAFSPDSQWIVSGSNDKTLRLWDTTSGEELLVMKGHSEGIRSVAVSPCGRRMVSAANDKTARLWDVQTGECLFVLEGHSSYIKSVIYSRDGRQVISAGWDRTVRFWDSETGEPRNILRYTADDDRCFAYSHDGRWIATGHEKSHLQLWDANTLKPGPVLSGHTDKITAVDFSSNGHWIVTSSMDRTVRLWDASTGTLVSIMHGDTGYTNEVSFSPDSLCIASAGSDKKVRLWEVNSGWSGAEQQDQTLPVLDVLYSTDGQGIFSCSRDSVQQWDSLTGVPGPIPVKLPKQSTPMTFLPDGRWIAAYNNNGSVQLWDLQDGVVKARLSGGVGRIDTTVYSPCGHWVVSCIFDGTVRMMDLLNLQHGYTRSAVIGKGVEDHAITVVFTPTGHRFAVGYSSGTIRIFDSRTRGLLITKKLVDERVKSLAYSPNGLQLAVGTYSGPIYLWDLHSEKPSTMLSGHVKWPRSNTYSTCGQWIASIDHDQTVGLWHQRLDTADESWSYVATVQGFFGTVRKVVWNPVIPLEFTTACKDGSVRVWRISSDNGIVTVNMLWGSNLRVLCTVGMTLKNTTGLSPTQQQLLLQRGAIGGTVVSKQREPNIEE